MKKSRPDDYEKINKLLKLIQKETKRVLDAIFTKVDKTAKTVQQFANENSNISRRAIKISVCVFLLTIVICGVNCYQVYVTRQYQNWTIKEMSRKPELYLEAREPDSDIEFIDKNIDSKAMIFRCNLVNSGDHIAKYIQIRHSLYLDYGSTGSIFVYSQFEDDLVFYNIEEDSSIEKYTGGDSIPGSDSFNTTKNQSFGDSSLDWSPPSIVENKFFTKKDKAVDSTFCIYVRKVDDTVCFKVTNRNTVSMKVYKNQEVIYYNQNEGQNYSVKLPYVWLLSNISPKTDTYSIPYSIDSDRGTFEGTLKIKKVFDKKKGQKE